MKRILFIFSLFAFALLANGQTKTVTGTVTDAKDGSTLPGVAVVVSGTNTGTITGMDGKFTIKVNSTVKTLHFSFIGMKNQDQAIPSNNIVNVALSEDAEQLDEVMVVAYGTSTKSSFTGSATKIDAKLIERKQATDLTGALAGTSGVQTSSSSGQPGKAANVRIRGVGSYSASSAPLYVVDGMPYDGDISAINNQDVESMTVLKDAASSALYGARGANGVILITTKKGKTGALTVTLDSKLGVNSRGVKEYNIMTDPGMYYETVYKSDFNYQKSQGKNDADIQANINKKFYNDPAGKYLGGYVLYNVPTGENLIGANGKLNPNATMGRLYQNDYYLTQDSWENQIMSNKSRSENNLSISGGTEKNKTYFSLGYLNDGGIIANSGYDRYSTRLKNNMQVTKWLKANIEAAYTKYDMKTPDLDASLSSMNPFYIARNMAPIYPVYVKDASGTIKKDVGGNLLGDYGTGQYPGLKRPFMSISNPATDGVLNTNVFTVDVVTLNGGAIANITKELKLTGNMSYNVDNTRQSSKQNAYQGQEQTRGGSIMKESIRTDALNSLLMLNYTKDWGDHNIEALAAHTMYNLKWEDLYGYKNNLFDPNSNEISNAITNPQIYSSSNSYSVEGYLAQIKYNYRSKYFASASYRRDGSSIFYKDNRWGNFWSVGGSWLLNKEHFLEDVSWINLLKYKLSYGAQGNDALQYNAPATFTNNKDRNYQAYADQYDISGSNNIFSTTMTYKGNKDLTWETNYNLNTGIEFELLGSRLNGSFEFFNRTVENMLFYRQVSPSVGYGSYPENMGSMRNRGVEIQLNGDVIKNDNITWSLNFNITSYKNTILSLPPEMASTEGGYIKGNNVLQVGHSIYDLFYPVYAGVDKANGKALYRITNDDGTYGTTADYSIAQQKKNSANAGSALPAAQGGFGTTLKAYHFDLSINCVYQIGGLVFDNAYQNLMHGDGQTYGSNWSKDILNAWTPENNTSNIPRLQDYDSYTNSTSSRFLTNASYLSINNIALGYNFSSQICKKIKLQSLRVYAVADNIALFSRRQGLDPRQSFNGATANTYSPIRTISGGIKLSF